MTSSVLPGFVDVVHDAQGCFRGLLTAMAHPGRIVTVPAPSGIPAGVAPATAALLLALCDSDTPVWLDGDAAGLRDWLVFHTGAPRRPAPSGAMFAAVLSPATMPRLDAFDWGTDEVPEASATLILQVEALSPDDGWMLRGPGIADTARLEVAGLPPSLFAERRAMQAAFPRGVDLVFACGHRLAALPRTTIVEA